MLYLALLPQFIDPEHGSVLAPVAAARRMQIAISVAVNAMIAVAAGVDRGISGRAAGLAAGAALADGHGARRLALRMAFEAKRT